MRVELTRIFEFNSWIDILNINGYFTQQKLLDVFKSVVNWTSCYQIPVGMG